MLFLSMSLLCSCMDKTDILREEITEMKSYPIILPLDKMHCWWFGRDTLCNNETSEMIKFVIYSDSIKCSSCALKDMYRWDDYIKRIRKFYDGELEMFFIFNPSRKDWKSFYLIMKTTPPAMSVYVDTLGIFECLNPHLPNNPMFHTFLLDENNNVLLVGNPLENEKIEKLFWQIVEEKLGKRE